MPEVSVVILNWNGRNHLERFLPSVVNNTPTTVNIVVADNGSDDDSVTFLEKHYPRVKLIRLEHNYGYAGGYNRALTQIDSDYSVLLNSDVETPAGWLEPLIEAVESDTGIAAVMPKIMSLAETDKFEYAGACGGFIDRFGYPFCRGRIMNHTEKDCGQYNDRREIFWASGACFIVRNSVFNRVGGFDEDFFAHMEEIDLCWRMQLYGYRILVEPASAVFHLGGGTLTMGSSRKIYLNFRNNLAMLYKNLPNPGIILFVRMLLDGLSAMVYLLSGRTSYFKAVWRAHNDYRKMKDGLMIKRLTIHENRVRKPAGIYNGSIILRYLIGKRAFDNIL